MLGGLLEVFPWRDVITWNGSPRSGFSEGSQLEGYHGGASLEGVPLIGLNGRARLDAVNWRRPLEGVASSGST
jgi:hypothetical protein